MDKSDQHLRSLISMAAQHIFATFQVTKPEARTHAEQLASLVDSKGGDITAFTLVQFREFVTNQLSNSKLPWKSLIAQEAAAESKRDTEQFKNDYLNMSRNPLTRKW